MNNSLVRKLVAVLAGAVLVIAPLTTTNTVQSAGGKLGTRPVIMQNYTEGDWAF